MIAFFIAPFLIALLIFVFVRAIKHIKTYNIRGIKVVEILFGLLLFGGLVCIIVGFLLPNGLDLKRIFTKIGYYWLGFILYFLIGLGISLLCRLLIWVLARKTERYNIGFARNFTILFVVVFTTLMSTYGIINAHNLRITNYEVKSMNKAAVNELNIVLIADLHLGYNVGVSEMEDMVDKINSLNPDIVVLAGDIFDNEFEAVEESERIAKILSNIDAKYGKYAVYGNHDIQEKILVGFTFNWSKQAKSKVQADERMNQFIKDAGFTFLYDSYEMVANSVYIYGRPDGEKINFGNMDRVAASDITKGMDQDLTIICVDHEPGELQQLAMAGVDIDLSGHTHNGQIWPGTITINLFWDNAYGLKKIINMSSIVTSGVGLFGVNMRTGCFPEIVNLKLTFTK